MGKDSIRKTSDSRKSNAGKRQNTKSKIKREIPNVIVDSKKNIELV